MLSTESIKRKENQLGNIRGQLTQQSTGITYCQKYIKYQNKTIYFLVM